MLREQMTGSDEAPEARLAGLKKLRQAFHAELANVAGPALNALLRDKEGDDVDSRRRASSWANEQLKDLGLAFRCPRTGEPSILVVDQRDAKDAHGRFRLEHREVTGRNVRTLTTTDLPVFDLMEDRSRRESLARKHRRAPEGPTR